MSMQYVTFSINREIYGIPIEIVAEIIKTTQITKIPRTLGFVEGIINLRGRIIPVIDMKKQFCLGQTETSDENRILVVEIKGETVGLIVENVHEVISLEDSEIEKIVGKQLLDNSGLIKGIGKWQDQLVILLEPKVILAPEELEHLGTVIEQVAI